MVSDSSTVLHLGNLKLPIDSDSYNYWHFVVYGRSGSGKSRFIQSSAECEFTSPALILDYERGSHSAKRLGAKVVNMQEFMIANNYGDIGLATNAVILQLLKTNPIEIPFKFLGLDSITELAKLYKDKLDGNNANPRNRYENFGKTLDYLSKLFRLINALPLHIGITAKERRFGQFDEDGNSIDKTILRPFLTENGSVDLVSVFDIVLHLEGDITSSAGKKAFKNQAITQITEAAEGKDRSGLLPIILEMPTMQNVFNIIAKGA